MDDSETLSRQTWLHVSSRNKSIGSSRYSQGCVFWMLHCTRTSREHHIYTSGAPGYIQTTRGTTLSGRVEPWQRWV